MSKIEIHADINTSNRSTEVALSEVNLKVTRVLADNPMTSIKATWRDPQTGIVDEGSIYLEGNQLMFLSSLQKRSAPIVPNAYLYNGLGVWEDRSRFGADDIIISQKILKSLTKILEKPVKKSFAPGILAVIYDGLRKELIKDREEADDEAIYSTFLSRLQIYIEQGYDSMFEAVDTSIMKYGDVKRKLNFNFYMQLPRGGEDGLNLEIDTQEVIMGMLSNRSSTVSLVVKPGYIPVYTDTFDDDAHMFIEIREDDNKITPDEMKSITEALWECASNTNVSRRVRGWDKVKENTPDTWPGNADSFYIDVTLTALAAPTIMDDDNEEGLPENPFYYLTMSMNIRNYLAL